MNVRARVSSTSERLLLVFKDVLHKIVDELSAGFPGWLVGRVFLSL